MQISASFLLKNEIKFGGYYPYQSGENTSFLRAACGEVRAKTDCVKQAVFSLPLSAQDCI